MSVLEKREKLYKKYNIDFSTIYGEFELRKVPFDRPCTPDKKSLDYYCKKVRELHRNIQKLCKSKEDEYIAKTALMDFYSMLGKNWEKKINEYEGIIKKYDDKVKLIQEELQNEERKEFGL